MYIYIENSSIAETTRRLSSIPDADDHRMMPLIADIAIPERVPMVKMTYNCSSTPIFHLFRLRHIGSRDEMDNFVASVRCEDDYKGQVTVKVKIFPKLSLLVFGVLVSTDMIYILCSELIYTKFVFVAIGFIAFITFCWYYTYLQFLKFSTLITDFLLALFNEA